MTTFTSISNVMLPDPDPAMIASLVPGSPVVISSSWQGLQVGPHPGNLLPFGSAYWTLMAPHMDVDLTGKKSGGTGVARPKKQQAQHEFPDELIKVPTNVKPKNLHKFNFYDLLGVGEHADSADEGAIRKGYHKCVLLYHPDKRQDKTASGAEDNSVWLKIQEAFATLLDINKRRAYDSQLPFDESTPTERDLDAALEADPENGFYKTFDSVFKRNGRFAESKPVPELGNASMAIETVEAFYSYWIKFDSWRDFTGKGAEYRPDEATSREEKRFMMKENEKLAVKLKKKEIARVTDMVMLAMKRDPRLLAHKQAQKEAKEAERLAKETAALNLGKIVH
jgi:curved DNA-binding protein CbpA